MDRLNDLNDDLDRIHGRKNGGLDDDDESAGAQNYDSDERIFRSSLCGMFEESQSSKTDACAVFCCGIYLWQRNQDVLMLENHNEDDFDEDDEAATTTTKSIYSTISKRPLEMLFLFMVASTIVVWSFDDPNTDHLFSTIVYGTAALLIVIVVWKGLQFQYARKKFRRQLAVAEFYRRYPNKKEHESENDPDLVAFLERHQQEISGDGAHDLCGCARSDSVDDDIANIDDDEESNDGNDFCSSAWRFLANLFCGMLCGCHLQLFGVCAVAQESRHLQEAIPAAARPGLWQRDYITMQPWTEYYPSILRLRLSNQINCLPHFKALSRLSRRILIGTVAFFLFVTVMFLLPIRFPKWQVIILYGTFSQPAIFLFFAHWLWNRLDLSLDAVIKYFACGFFVCTSGALVYEWLVSKVTQESIALINRLGTKGLVLFADHTHHPADEDVYLHGYVGYPLWYQLTIASLTAFVNAFFVAGMTEEICKYLCFWMVEHPDLELENRVILPVSSVRCETDQHSRKSDHEDTEITRLLSQDQSTRLSTSDPEQQIVFAPTASLVSIGEAITVAMITLALGFTCAENLLYIFVYTSRSFSAEIGTLYVRCLFPIHPMTAALQSIGVCRRDLEKDSSVGIGRILLPAWFLHGFFDFSLMAYANITQILDRRNHSFASNHPPEIEPGGGESVDTDEGEPFLVYVMIVPFVAMMYFLNESFNQRERLEQLDKENRMQS